MRSLWQKRLFNNKDKNIDLILKNNEKIKLKYNAWSGIGTEFNYN